VGPARLSSVGVGYGTLKLEFGNDVNHAEVYSPKPDGTYPEKASQTQYTGKNEFHLKPGRHQVKIMDVHSVTLFEFAVDIKAGETAAITPESLSAGK